MLRRKISFLLALLLMIGALPLDVFAYYAGDYFNRDFAREENLYSRVADYYGAYSQASSGYLKEGKPQRNITRIGDSTLRTEVVFERERDAHGDDIAVFTYKMTRSGAEFDALTTYFTAVHGSGLGELTIKGREVNIFEPIVEDEAVPAPETGEITDEELPPIPNEEVPEWLKETEKIEDLPMPEENGENFDEPQDIFRNEDKTAHASDLYIEEDKNLFIEKNVRSYDDRRDDVFYGVDNEITPVEETIEDDGWTPFTGGIYTYEDYNEIINLNSNIPAISPQIPSADETDVLKNENETPVEVVPVVEKEIDEREEVNIYSVSAIELTDDYGEYVYVVTAPIIDERELYFIDINTVVESRDSIGATGEKMLAARYSFSGEHNDRAIGEKYEDEMTYGTYSENGKRIFWTKSYVNTSDEEISTELNIALDSSQSEADTEVKIYKRDYNGYSEVRMPDFDIVDGRVRIYTLAPGEIVLVHVTANVLDSKATHYFGGTALEPTVAKEVYADWEVVEDEAFIDSMLEAKVLDYIKEHGITAEDFNNAIYVPKAEVINFYNNISTQPKTTETAIEGPEMMPRMSDYGFTASDDFEYSPRSDVEEIQLEPQRLSRSADYITVDGVLSTIEDTLEENVHQNETYYSEKPKIDLDEILSPEDGLFIRYKNADGEFTEPIGYDEIIKDESITLDRSANDVWTASREGFRTLNYNAATVSERANRKKFDWLKILFPTQTFSVGLGEYSESGKLEIADQENDIKIDPVTGKPVIKWTFTSTVDGANSNLPTSIERYFTTTKDSGLGQPVITALTINGTRYTNVSQTTDKHTDGIDLMKSAKHMSTGTIENGQYVFEIETPVIDERDFYVLDTHTRTVADMKRGDSITINGIKRILTADETVTATTTIRHSVPLAASNDIISWLKGTPNLKSTHVDEKVVAGDYIDNDHIRWIQSYSNTSNDTKNYYFDLATDDSQQNKKTKIYYYKPSSLGYDLERVELTTSLSYEARAVEPGWIVQAVTETSIVNPKKNHKLGNAEIDSLIGDMVINKKWADGAEPADISFSVKSENKNESVTLPSTRTEAIIPDINKFEVGADGKLKRIYYEVTENVPNGYIMTNKGYDLKNLSYTFVNKKLEGSSGGGTVVPNTGQCQNYGVTSLEPLDINEYWYSDNRFGWGGCA